MDVKKMDSKRRFFLTAATAGSALAVAVAMSGRKGTVAQTPAAAPAQPEDGVGYHETDHIRTYYSTAAYF